MTNVKEKYQDFLNLPFPEGLRGKEVLGIDLVMLDADTAGIIDKYISYKRNLTKSDSSILQRLNMELKSVTEKLTGIGQTYFSILWEISDQILSELQETRIGR